MLRDGQLGAPVERSTGSANVQAARMASASLTARTATLTLDSGRRRPPAHSARIVTAATSAAANLPAVLGSDLLDVARAVFINGLNVVVAGVAAAVFAGLAVLTVVVLRGTEQAVTSDEPGRTLTLAQVPPPRRSSASAAG